MTRSELIVCSLEAWDEIWRRNQFLVAGLLERDADLRVLFVEPPADPLHSLRSKRRAASGAGLRPAPGWGPRLHLFQPTKWLPRVLGPLADLWLRRSLRQAVRRLGLVDPLLWINDPSWAGLTSNHGWPAIYDITDDWLAARRGRREHRRLVANERRLLEVCREVVVCSEMLASTKGAYRPVRVVPNAVDVQRFRQARDRPLDLPPGPAAVYVGTLHEDRLDVALCRRLARRLEAAGAALVLVGPVALSKDNDELLRSTPGAILLGGRPNHAIPGYLQHADALVVPHVVDGFTNSLDPIKLYEYEAVARPIITTPVAGFRDLAGLPGVSVARDEEFVTEVLNTLHDPPATVGPFVVPDWSERVLAMAQLLEATRSSSRRGASSIATEP